MSIYQLTCATTLLDFTPAPLHLGGLAIRQSELKSACEAESVCDGVNII